MFRRLAILLIAGSVTAPLTAQSEATPPRSVRNVAPVYPYDLLIQGKDGSAEVLFTIDYAGKAILGSAVKASDPAFAKALLADIEANEFLPPRVNGKPKLSQAKLPHTFRAGFGLDATAREILTELRKPLPSLTRADQLDKKPVTIRQDQSTYPYSLQSDGVSGRAEIEIVIDRTGRVLFPRILSATNDDIGYAAATAVTRWRYQPPMKGGVAVDARATVTVTYDQAKMAAAW